MKTSTAARGGGNGESIGPPALKGDVSLDATGGIAEGGAEFGGVVALGVGGHPVEGTCLLGERAGSRNVEGAPTFDPLGVVVAYGEVGGRLVRVVASGEAPVKGASRVQQEAPSGGTEECDETCDDRVLGEWPNGELGVGFTEEGVGDLVLADLLPPARLKPQLTPAIRRLGNLRHVMQFPHDRLAPQLQEQVGSQSSRNLP